MRRNIGQSIPNEEIFIACSPYTIQRAMTVTLSPGEAHTLQMIEAWAREQTIVYLFFFLSSKSVNPLFDVFSYNTHDLVRSIVCNFTQISTVYFTARHDMCEEIQVKWKWNGDLIEKCILLIESRLSINGLLIHCVYAADI